MGRGVGVEQEEERVAMAGGGCLVLELEPSPVIEVGIIDAEKQLKTTRSLPNDNIFPLGTTKSGTIENHGSRVSLAKEL